MGHENCPQCGTKKHQLMVCPKCGFYAQKETWLPARPLDESALKERENALAERRTKREMLRFIEEKGHPIDERKFGKNGKPVKKETWEKYRIKPKKRK